MRAGQCWFHQIRDGGNHLVGYGPHEPRADLPVLGVMVVGDDDHQGQEIFVCKHCACLYWPDDGATNKGIMVVPEDMMSREEDE